MYDEKIHHNAMSKIFLIQFFFELKGQHFIETTTGCLHIGWFLLSCSCRVEIKSKLDVFIPDIRSLYKSQ